MGTLWKVTKGIFTITGAYCWIMAIKDSIKEYNEKKDEPLVQPVMYMGRK